ncbi:MAG: phosphodiester glycosidase family protein [Verrucomicrobia bacterium]|nr:phosphodiester glycosidase family protein [Verrucomicrobiota bacterium]MBI3869626.1 phosphodiester glycosidase family protein [Verrucomicrobiota bacterium]
MSLSAHNGCPPWRSAWVAALLAVIGGAAGLRAEDAASTAVGSKPSSTGSGVTYRNEKIPDKPLSIHIVKVDRSRQDLVLSTSLGKGTVLDLSPLSDQVKALQRTNQRPQVAINGDFYRTEREPFAGDPLGFQVMEGELISSSVTNKPCFWLDEKSQPHIGIVRSAFQVKFPDGRALPVEVNEERARGSARLYTPRLGASTQTTGGREFVLERSGELEWLPLKPGMAYAGKVREVRDAGNTKLAPDIMVLSVDAQLLSSMPALKPGDSVEIETTTFPDTRGCETAIGGGPALVRDGKMGGYSGNKTDRHPRSAFGWNDSHWFFVEVDGRQSNLSIGMTLPEFSEYLRTLGVKEALNLDGGGSATLWLFGQVVNSPCYGYERSTANGLLILKRDAPRREPD